MQTKRTQTTKRHSQAVAYGATVYLAGITATDRALDAAGQTSQIFARIDSLLEQQGATRSDLLSAQVWLRDIDRDFSAFNAEWEEWMPEGDAPARAVVEAKMAAPDILVEVMVVAAKE